MISFNDSFGEGEYIDEDNSNFISFAQEDIKTSIAATPKYSIHKQSTNDISISHSYNNILCSVPMDIEFENEELNYDNNIYLKEYIKFHISNVINIIKSKIIIIKTKTFYFIKNIYIDYINKMIQRKVIYLQLSLYLNRISNIIRKYNFNIMYQTFYIFKNRISPKNTNNNIYGVNLLENEIKCLENNIDNLTYEENKIKSEINNFFHNITHSKKEIQKSEKNISKNTNFFDNSKNILTISNKFEELIFSFNSYIHKIEKQDINN